MSAADRSWHWVTEALALGGRLPDQAAPELLADRVRRVVDLRGELIDDRDWLQSQGILLLHLPTADLRAVSAAHLEMGVRWVREGHTRGERVLVHCEHGIGRSALLACCVLVAEGRSPLAALTLVKDMRARVCPSPEQLHALLDWSADWCLAHDRAPPAETWGDLARIAYRDLR